jgi:hypothetical protein
MRANHVHLAPERQRRGPCQPGGKAPGNTTAWVQALKGRPEGWIAPSGLGLTFLSCTRSWKKEGRRRKAPSAFASKTGPTSPRLRRARRLQRSCCVSIVAHGPIPHGLAMSNVARASRSCPLGEGEREEKSRKVWEMRASPHFPRPFYCGLFFPVVAAFRLLTPRAVCSHTALRPSRRAPCHTGKFPRLVTKSVRNAGQAIPVPTEACVLRPGLGPGGPTPSGNRARTRSRRRRTSGKPGPFGRLAATNGIE